MSVRFKLFPTKTTLVLVNCPHFSDEVGQTYIQGVSKKTGISVLGSFEALKH